MSRILSLSFLVAGLISPSFAFQISSSCDHTAIIKNDSSLWLSGSGKLGRLGNGDSLDVGSFQKIGLATDKWIDVSAGCEGTSAIKSDGSLWAWGANGNYQLGTGVQSSIENTPQLVSGGPWLKVSLGMSQYGSQHTLALDTNHELWSWGSNNYGELGLGTTGQQENTPVKVPGSIKWRDIQAGANFSVGLDLDGKLYTWGSNMHGVLGDGGAQDKASPTQVGGDIYKSIAVAKSHVMAIKDDGSLWVWGSNNQGELGLGGFSDFQSSPTQILSSKKIEKISAGRHSALAIDEAGKLWAWGDNARGQLSLPGGGSYAEPTLVNGDSYSNVWAAGDFTFVLKNTGQLYGFGASEFGQLGLGKLNENLAYKISNQKFKKVSYKKSEYYTESMPENFGMAIDAQGKLWGWGANYNGMLANPNVRDDGMGIGGLTGKVVEVGNPDYQWEKVDIGSDFVIGLQKDSTLWSWGGGMEVLGRNIATWQVDSIPVSLGAEKWIDVCVGTNYAVAISSDSLLFTWGLNYHGQLGSGDLNSTSLPTQVSDLKWTSISCGFSGAYGRTNLGLNFKWGKQLNAGGSSEDLLSITPFVNLFTEMSAGINHGLGLSDSLVYVWGQNDNLQLGFPAAFNTIADPTVLDGISNIKRVVAAPNHSYAIDYDGFLWRWGANSAGQLGTGDKNNLSGPSKLNSETWLDITGGLNNTIGLKTDSTLWCLGMTKDGMCGPVAYETPTPVLNIPTLTVLDVNVDAPAEEPHVDFQLFEFYAQNSSSKVDWELISSDSRFSMNNNRLLLSGAVSLPADSLINLKVVATDQNFSDTSTVIFRATAALQSPDSIWLVSNTIEDGFPASSFITIVGVRDLDQSLGHFWSIDTGLESTSFQMKGDSLFSMVALSHSIQSELRVPFTVGDSTGNFFKDTLSVFVNPPILPTVLSLSYDSILEYNVGPIGQFLVSPLEGDTFGYTLVADTDSTDEDKVTISNDSLHLTSVVDYEDPRWTTPDRVRPMLRVGVQVVRNLTDTTIHELQLWVKDVNEAPTGFHTDNQDINFGALIGDTIAQMQVDDQDFEDTHSFQIEPGYDSALFRVNDKYLLMNELPEWPKDSLVELMVSAKDQGGLVYTTIFQFFMKYTNQDPLYIKTIDTIVVVQDAGLTTGSFILEKQGVPGDRNALTLNTWVADSSIYQVVPHILTSPEGDIEFQFGPDIFGEFEVETELQELDTLGGVVRVSAVEKTLLIVKKALELNVAPDRIDISTDTIANNLPASSFVANLSAHDSNQVSNFKWSLIPGLDAARFNLVNDSLFILEATNYTIKTSYQIGIKVEDDSLASFEDTLDIFVRPSINKAPISIGVSNNLILESLAVGDTITNLFTVDPDVGDSHTYNIEPGLNDSLLKVEGDFLVLNRDLTLPQDSASKVIIATEDNYGLRLIDTLEFLVEKEVSIVPLSLVTVDTIRWLQNSAKANYPMIVSHEGTANAGNTLKWIVTVSDSSIYHSLPQIVANPNLEVEIDVKASIAGQFQIMTQLVEDSLGIIVRSSNVETTHLLIAPINNNQAPTSLTSSTLDIPLGKTVGDTIAFFYTTDPDVSDTHMYFLEPGLDSALFSISQNVLILKEPLSWPADSAINIKVRVEDQDGLSFVNYFEYLMKSTSADPLTLLAVPEINIDQDAGIVQTQLITGQTGSEGNGNSFEYKITVNDTNIYQVYPQLVPTPPGAIAFNVKPGIWGQFTINSQILEKDGAGDLVRASNITTTKLVINRAKADSIFLESVDSLFAIEDGGITQKLLVNKVSGDAGQGNRWGVYITTQDSSVFSKFPYFIEEENGIVEFETVENFFGPISLITEMVELSPDNNVVQRFNSDTTSLLIRAVNDAPILEVSNEQLIQTELRVGERLDSFIVLATSGAKNEDKQILSFEWKIADSSAFVKIPTLDASGGLDFQLNDNVNFPVSAKLYLRDNGGVFNGGQDESFIDVTFKHQDQASLPQKAAPVIPNISNRFPILKIDSSMEVTTNISLKPADIVDTVIWLDNDEVLYLRYRSSSDSSHSEWVKVDATTAVQKELFINHEGSILGVDLAHQYASETLYKQSVDWRVISGTGDTLSSNSTLRGVVYPITSGEYTIEYTVYDSLADYSESGESSYNVAKAEVVKISSSVSESIWSLGGLGNGATQSTSFSEFWTWDPSADFDELMARYTVVEQGENLEVGRGYWVRIDSTIDLDMSEMSYKDGEAELKLIAEGDGWYLISNPYDFALEISDIEGSENLDFWTWNRGTTDYSKATKLSPFQGAWVNVKNDVVLKFPFKPSFLNVEDSALAKALTRQLSNEAWSVALNLKAGNREDVNNKVGVMRNGYEAKVSTEIPQPQDGKVNLAILSENGSLLRENVVESTWGNPRWGLVFQSGISGVSKADFWVDETELNILAKDGKSLWLIDRQGERELNAGEALTVSVNQSGSQAVLELRDANYQANKVMFNINSRNSISISESLLSEAPTEIRLVGFDGRISQNIAVDYDSQSSTITPKENAKSGLYILEVCNDNSCASLGLAQFK